MKNKISNCLPFLNKLFVHELIWHIYRILIVLFSSIKIGEGKQALLDSYQWSWSWTSLQISYAINMIHMSAQRERTTCVLMIVWAIGVRRQAQRWHSDQIKHKTYTCFCLHKQCQAYDGTVGIPPHHAEGRVWRLQNDCTARTLKWQGCCLSISMSVVIGHHVLHDSMCWLHTVGWLR